MNNYNVRNNERSWAIEIISQINSYVDANDLIIKRAGGEFTISSNLGGRMFPDVILYADNNLNTILQGWELKMPDVPITDEVFIADAQRKAKALGLDSCLIWNFTYAKFYVLNEETNDFKVVQEWENRHIQTRQDVSLYRTEWENMLKDVIISINIFLQTHSVKNISISHLISKNAINILINQNKNIVADNYEKQCKRDSVLGAMIDSWWESVKIEYSFDETNKYIAFSKSIILNWTYRIIFAHLIKRQQKSAMLINELNENTTPDEANSIFNRITEKCDFYNVFAPLEYNTILPEKTWHDLLDFSLFLKENGIRNINQKMLQNILENCINTTRRELDGQYTTPEILAKILVAITVHDSTLDCADPCCGTGTIAHEILEKKKCVGCSAENAIKTTWASDKYSVPLQIANISMTSSETINQANFLFQSNALDLHIGKTIDIVDPKNGIKLSFSVPLFGSICSNLPFVSFENIHDDDKQLIQKYMPDCNLDKKSDLSYYLALHFEDLLIDGGYLGIITSNSWLGTVSGVKFYTELTNRYNLKQVHISGSGRWFQNADVVATLLILQKKNNKKGIDYTSFYIWNKPLEFIAKSSQLQKVIINTSLLDKEQDSRIISCVKYTNDYIKRLHNMNLSYNALFHNVSWLLDIRKKLVPIKSLFKIFRGSRRGWDALFFPKNACKIEKDFILPALFNAKKITTLVAVPDCVAFSCSKDIKELKTSYPRAYEWVKSFENEKNVVGKPLPQVLERKHEKWYEMKPTEIAKFFTMMNPDDRIFFGKFKEPSFINQRLIGLIPLNLDGDVELYHALLNSVLMKFFIEAVGFGRGLGVLDINKESIAKCFLLNPDLLSSSQINKIKGYFQNVCKKDIMPVESELYDEDWISFNHSVLEAFGIDEYYDKICNSLRSLRKVRKAAKEKFGLATIELDGSTQYAMPDDESISIAAEPMNFEYYSWNRFDSQIIKLFGCDTTILLGCFKNKKHLDWIISNGIYNIRLGDRKGAVYEEKECIGKASLLVLYDVSKPNDLSVYKILSHRVLTDVDLKALNYPKKRIGKRYMTFKIIEDPSFVENLKSKHLIENLIAIYPNHIKGAPVFLEP